MRLHITHETRYDYRPAVETAQHLACLRPRATLAQQVLAHELFIDPSPANVDTRVDAWGNTRHFFSYHAPHPHLAVVSRATVQTQALPPLQGAPCATPWEQVREHFRYRAGGRWGAAAEMAFASAAAPRHADFVQFAQADFSAGRPFFEACIALTGRIHAECSYESNSTEVDTPVREALAQRRGVCQDFAHIFIACLRSLGLPARYVSGYLLTEPPPGQPRLVGADASHAWASVYLPFGDSPEPGGAWIDFDPTNNRHGVASPGPDYVTVAWGRDYFDVAPLRGLIHGGADHHLQVAVTVLPEELPVAMAQPDA